MSLRRRWASLRARMGNRGDALLFFALIDFAQALTLWSGPTTPNPTYDWFGHVMPLDVWAAFWAAAGSVCVYHAFRVDDHFGFVPTTGIMMVWAIGCAAGWLLANVTPLGVAVWTVFALFVWRIAGWPEPGPPREDHDS